MVNATDNLRLPNAPAQARLAKVLYFWALRAVQRPELKEWISISSM